MSRAFETQYVLWLLSVSMLTITVGFPSAVKEEKFSVVCSCSVRSSVHQQFLPMIPT